MTSPSSTPFSAVPIIEKKRDGHKLADKEIQDLVLGLSDGSVPDYQISAWLMAVMFRGLDLDETVALTQSMLDSGERYKLASVPGPKFDKHSTGGVGDKVSLILAPLAAACGLKVPMMSGRGLGHTGGTLDKLESIPGFRVGLSREEFEGALLKVGCAMIGQSKTMVPADRKLYSLRDVTGTVESISLITASILSKKLAEGANGLVLDIKVGTGAFFQSIVKARALAKSLVTVGKKLGLPIRCVLTNMDQPLGFAVGNALEVLESVEVLKGLKPGSTLNLPNVQSSDLKELSLHLVAEMLVMAKVSKTHRDGRKLAQDRLLDLSAWKKFREMVVVQGGRAEAVDHPEHLPISERRRTILVNRPGFIHSMDTAAIGKLVVSIGGGRARAEDAINPRVGLAFHHKLGARVAKGDPLVTLFLPENALRDTDVFEEQLRACIKIGPTRKNAPKLVMKA